ncbi:zinc finger and BTB domain-containing protein 17-like, partial [Branchiostoma floridae]|uniref:Zinc finger and BTB domain-containing protein 17-like n=2 Tax=Branchiostoma floridae TaxID=7739 RepID=A0A9J7MK47_BRAFL
MKDFSEHCQEVLRRLNSQRLNSQLCDITIKVEGHQFSVHRAILAACSDYFLDLFTFPMGEKLDSVELPCVTHKGLAPIIEYAYTASLPLTNENVIDVISAASRLHMCDIIDECSVYLKESWPERGRSAHILSAMANRTKQSPTSQMLQNQHLHMLLSSSKTSPNRSDKTSPTQVEVLQVDKHGQVSISRSGLQDGSPPVLQTGQETRPHGFGIMEGEPRTKRLRKARHPLPSHSILRQAFGASHSPEASIVAVPEQPSSSGDNGQEEDISTAVSPPVVIKQEPPDEFDLTLRRSLREPDSQEGGDTPVAEENVERRYSIQFESFHSPPGADADMFLLPDSNMQARPSSNTGTVFKSEQQETVTLHEETGENSNSNSMDNSALDLTAAQQTLSPQFSQTEEGYNVEEEEIGEVSSTEVDDVGQPIWIQKPQDCTNCGRTFADDEVLRQHLESCSPDKPYRCPICNYAFKKPTQLNAHMRGHSEQERMARSLVKCKLCDAKFTSQGYLSRHMKSHSAFRPHLCKVCGAHFSASANLLLHMRMHEGRSPYKCDLCNARYMRPGDLSKHVRLFHKEKPFQCAACSESFSYQICLEMHVLRYHTPMQIPDESSEQDENNSTVGSGEENAKEETD